jgi:hypothetical protein
MNTSARLLQGLLMFVGASHILIGVLAMFPFGRETLASTVYGATVNWSPELAYLMQPIGVFMIGLGLVGCLAARHPMRARGIAIIFALMLLARVVQRFVFADDITAAFAIPTARLYSAAAFFFVVAVMLLVTAAGARERSA